MSDSINIAKTIVRGAVIGLNAYVKPGGLHRLSPVKLFDEVLCNILSSMEHLVEAYDLGEQVRKGEIAATGIDYSKVYSGILREAFRTCGTVHPQYVVPLSVYALVLGLSGVESVIEESTKFKKALDTVNAVSKWSDLKQFIELLKTIGRSDMFEHLQSLGYTQLTLLKSGVSFNDLFRVLGSKWRGFTLIESREGAVFGYLKKLMDYHKNYKAQDLAIIAFYMDLVRPNIPQQFQERIQSVESCKYMATAECAKQMYELDMLFRKNKLLFEWASEITVLITALGAYEGLK